MPSCQEDTELPLDDEAFKRYREKRILEMVGGVAEVQSEGELIEKTKTLKMIVHFYKTEFRRCSIMDQRLQEVSREFPDIMFYRVNADICPIVSEKLGIRMLPFLGFFKDGYFVDQMVGFEQLGDDGFVTGSLKKRILKSNIFKPVSNIQ